MNRKLGWRTCPKCKSRATKLFNCDTGILLCQACHHKYESPNYESKSKEETEQYAQKVQREVDVYLGKIPYGST